MAVVAFPPVENADEDGLLAIGGDLEISSLLLAYTNGIFPWPISDRWPLAWFSPNPRGILECKDLHISKSMRKTFRQSGHTVKFNENFEQVITKCATVPRKGQKGQTWITPQIIKGYMDLFKAGNAYCFEAWKEGELVGGIYGVSISHYISGESMFFEENNASKFILITMMKTLNKLGVDWIDTQMVTPVVSSLGGKGIDRKDFLTKLNQSLVGNDLTSILAKSGRKKVEDSIQEVCSSIANT